MDALLDFLNSMYTTLAMVNYPYASDFLMPLPAEPVRYVCQYLQNKLAGEELLKVLSINIVFIILFVTIIVLIHKR